MGDISVLCNKQATGGIHCDALWLVDAGAGGWAIISAGIRRAASRDSRDPPVRDFADSIAVCYVKVAA